MQIPVLIEPLDGGRFRARAGAPFDISEEGASKEEATQRLKERLRDRCLAGADVVMVSVPVVPRDTSWIGAAKDYPYWDEFLKAIEDYRKRMDAQDP